MRNITFTEGEYYHIYNRGTDKRDIYADAFDFARFLESMIEFNTEQPIGSIYEHRFPLGSPASKLDKPREKLVDIVAYCLNPNHFHFLLRQRLPRGIEKFMQRLGTGYTKYFNHKYERSGVLFQGKFKAIHINSNDYFLHLSAYINLNNRVHQLGSSASKSSLGEYMGKVIPGICATDLILGQFRNFADYQMFLENSLQGTLERRRIDKEFRTLLFD